MVFNQRSSSIWLMWTFNHVNLFSNTWPLFNARKSLFDICWVVWLFSVLYFAWFISEILRRIFRLGEKTVLIRQVRLNEWNHLISTKEGLTAWNTPRSSPRTGHITLVYFLTLTFSPPSVPHLYPFFPISAWLTSLQDTPLFHPHMDKVWCVFLSKCFYY